ncbi:MAG TPA: hypothetical protein VNP36_07670 [Burkholderiales bacterium]|nr:hypothetical protein [Burkholderiales bacterium]
MDKAQIAQSLLFDPVNEALSLYRRYHEGKGFKHYVTERMALLVPIGLLMAVTSIACAAATVLYLGGTRSFLVLLAILLVPFVLLGSAFVQAYIFLSWLEGRALARALHRKPGPAGPIATKLLEAGIDLGNRPPVPWVLAALFLLLPLAMLWLVVPQLAFLLIALHVAAPFAFARLDR